MSDENIEYTGPIPDYIRNHIERAEAIIDRGGEVYWKFTGAHCGARQSFEEMGALHVTASCEECGGVTDLFQSASADVGFDAILPTTPEAAAALGMVRTIDKARK